MNGLVEQSIMCPYCGESITVMIDASVSNQSYIEDCQVCCCPINFDVSVSGQDDISVSVRSDNE